MKLCQRIFDRNRESVRRAARGVAIASAAFALLLSTLLVVNYFQFKSVDPLHSRALDKLVREFRANPEDQQLKEEIRALNLLSRKAFFAHRWQLATGGGLLLLSLLVLAVSLKLAARPRLDLPDLSAAPSDEAAWQERKRSRRWLAATGVLLLALAVTAGLAFRRDLESAQPFSGSRSLASAEDYAKNWANFRGPGAAGIATADRAPLSWDGASGKGLRWKTEVPKPGYSSPVIWGQRLFLTGADEKSRELYCFDTEKGKLLWQKPVGATGTVPTVHRDTGFAASSAATNGRHVFAIFATGDLAAFDMDGKPLWSQNLGQPENHYGHSSSLITFEDLVIVQFDENSASRVLALDAETGAPAWQVDRTVISWASPILVNTGSRQELIVTNSVAVSSFDPRTGALLWEEKCLGGEVGPSAAYDDGMVFVANEFSKASGIRLEGGKAKVVWEYSDKLPDTASPLAAKGLLFLATSKGDIICLDAKTGKPVWEHAFNDGFYASPILVGGNVYAMDLSGTMHIFAADRTFRLLGESALGEPSSCTAAALDGRLYLRGDRFLYCAGE